MMQAYPFTLFRRITFLLAIILMSAGVVVSQSASTKIEGRGDSVSAIVTLQKGLLMVGAAYKGQRNFVVQLVSTDGEKAQLLVNTIGNYQGVRLVPVDGARYRLQVRADQAWVLMHEQPDPQKAGNALPISHTHSGDAPLGPFSLKRGLLRAAFTHEGAQNFVATLYRSDGTLAGLLVNKIGRYSGTVTESVPEQGLYWLEVRASGAWSVKLEMDE